MDDRLPPAHTVSMTRRIDAALLVAATLALAAVIGVTSVAASWLGLLH